MDKIDFENNNNSLIPEKAMSINSFENRKRKDGYANRKKIIIKSQTPEEIEADIVDYPFDENNEDEIRGTAITATVMQEFHDSIVRSEGNVKTAYTIAKTAYLNSDEAYEIAKNSKEESSAAKEQAESANLNSVEACRLAQEALDYAVSEIKGTNVTVGGELQEDYEMNQKADQTAFDELKAKVEVLEYKEVITNIVYDATTDTFTI